jgi:hypothetical protein
MQITSEEMGHSKIFIFGSAVILLLFVFLLLYYKSNYAYIRNGEFQPPPPKGISVISGIVAWYYSNLTKTIVVINATSPTNCLVTSNPNQTSECIISVTKGQKITLTRPVYVYYNYSVPQPLIDCLGYANYTCIINETGNLTLSNSGPRVT